MSEKRPRLESEMLAGKQPNARACETCMLRQTEFNGIMLDRADTDTCQIYESPETKPSNVYWDGADCDYRVKD
jgi:hypothetical protein